MESSAVPNKLFRFPGTPVATQQLSSTQATSTITTTSQELPVSLSPAIVALQKATLKPQLSTNSKSTVTAMARDNGKRGSYRHASSPETKQASDIIELEHTSPVGNNSPRADIHISPPPLPTSSFKNLKRDAIDDLGPLGDKFFDSVPSSLNAKYPTMSMPGSMPRRLLGTPRVRFDNSPTWNETFFAGLFFSFALYGFFYTMYSGFNSIGMYLWALFAELIGKQA